MSEETTPGPVDTFVDHLRDTHRLKRNVDYTLACKYGKAVLAATFDTWFGVLDEHVWVLMEKYGSHLRINEVRVINAENYQRRITHMRVSYKRENVDNVPRGNGE